jgi:sugar phosphate isomerase/epimerase
MGEAMKIGVFSVLFGDKPFEATLDYLQSLGVEAVEIGTGAYPGDAHCKPSALLSSEAKLKAFRQAITRRGMVISALSCHGNPLHPNRRVAQADHRVFEQTLKLARALDVQTVITFSGCPGGGPSETQPNWIVAPWPPEFSAMLEWQWKERVTPYWKSAAKLARASGVRVGIEMHPNFVVYNPETMQRLRAIAPAVIGCNFDPSHMFWQGVDPVAAIRYLADAIYHVHAKDCRLEPELIARSGVLDAKSYTRELERAWLFRTVGYGNGASVWKAIVSTLRMVGYDHVLSIEHEDSLMSPAEGLSKAVAFLKDLVIADPPGEAYWA